MPTFSLKERFRIAWEMAWPVTVADIIVAVLIVLTFPEMEQSLDAVWAIVAFFAVAPWVIMRAFRRTYGGKKFVVVRPKHDSGELRYQESLKVMWLLSWRSLVLVLLAILVFSAVLRLLGVQLGRVGVESPMANAVGLSLVDLAINLGAPPFLMPGMMRKKYEGFRLAVEPMLK